jgi:hypothetical protein
MTGETILDHVKIYPRVIRQDREISRGIGQVEEDSPTSGSHPKSAHIPDHHRVLQANARIRLARGIHLTRWPRKSQNLPWKRQTTDFPTAATLLTITTSTTIPRRVVQSSQTPRYGATRHYRYIYPPGPSTSSFTCSSFALIVCPSSVYPTNHSGGPLSHCLSCLSSMHILHPNSPELPGSLVSSKQARAEEDPTNTTDDIHHQQADMPDAILDDISHRRFNPLRSSWVLVSPHRTKRPWQGAQESAVKSELPDYDEAVRLSEQFET